MNKEEPEAVWKIIDVVFKFIVIIALLMIIYHLEDINNNRPVLPRPGEVKVTGQ